MREWGRTDEGEIQVLFRSKDRLDKLIAAAERAADRINDDLSGDVGITSVAGTPRRPVFFYHHSDTKSGC